MAGNQTILVAARYVSADRKPASSGSCKKDVSAERTTEQYWGLPDMFLLTGNQPVVGAAR
jgi:hypothetical protein